MLTSWNNSILASLLAPLLGLQQPAKVENENVIKEVWPTTPVVIYKYREEIIKAAELAKVPPVVIISLVEVESRFNIHATSRVGAIGLGQFMPRTAEYLSRKYSRELFPVDYYDPRWQFTAIGIYLRELRMLHDAYGMYQVECNKIGSILSSYNGGFSWAKKRYDMSGKSEDYWQTVRKINPGITKEAQAENQLYAVKIYKAQYRYQLTHFCN